MDARKREIRTVDCQLSIREAEEGQESQSRTITGTAIVFNAESEVLDDWGERFREVIKPEACTMEFLNTQDVKMNLLHERELTIARCNKGKGSMRLLIATLVTDAWKWSREVTTLAARLSSIQRTMM